MKEPCRASGGVCLLMGVGSGVGRRVSPGEPRSNLKGREAQRGPLLSPPALSPYPRAKQAGRFSEAGVRSSSMSGSHPRSPSSSLGGWYSDS